MQAISMQCKDSKMPIVGAAGLIRRLEYWHYSKTHPNHWGLLHTELWSKLFSLYTARKFLLRKFHVRECLAIFGSYEWKTETLWELQKCRQMFFENKHLKTQKFCPIIDMSRGEEPELAFFAENLFEILRRALLTKKITHQKHPFM